MAGAAILAARAAYRTGAGMVKVITAEENRQILQQGIPEALYGSCRQLSESMEWADVIAVGPGIGREEQALECLKKVVEKSRKPLVMDADALNLLAEENGKELAEKLRTQGAEGRIIILTPHVGELSRLLAKTIPECKKELPECGRELAERFHGVAVAKDARTIVCKE
ncbi:MAG: NAD(P)H-hydrate dehydratase, partial [Waltera sp.]